MVHRTAWLAFGLSCALAVAPALWAQGVCSPSMDGDIAKQMYEPDAIYWQPLIEYDQMVLRVDAPCDTIEKIFKRGETPFFELREVLGQVDGTYRWELRAEPVVDPEVRAALKKAHETGDDSIVRKLQDEGRLPKGPFVESEAFSVVDGRIVQPVENEEKAQFASRSLVDASGNLLASASVSGGVDREQSGDNWLSPKDVLHYDDVIITGSLCIGFDCVNGETFGYDTLKLKENNLRIGFDDTSTGSFPTGNWQIRANDSTSGGKSYLGFVDMGSSGTSTGGSLVFAVEAGAPSNALYVEDAGRVGLGTSAPVVQLHIVDGNTPTVRLDQDGSSGFAPQRWDVAGNETNFFVRDVTSGSTLPLRIRPGAPTSSIEISSTGRVGIGTSSPSTALHVKRTNGTAAVKVEETSGTAADRNLLTLENNGPPTLLFDNNNAASNATWTYTVTNGGIFQINASGSGSPIELQLSAGGDMTIGGTLTELSSRSAKTDFQAIEPEEVLARLTELPITLWRYQHDDAGTVHLGPMAEDFFVAFGLGSDPTHIAPSDKAGVALAAIQGLQATVRNAVAEKDRQIEELQQRIEALEALLVERTAEGSARP